MIKCKLTKGILLLCTIALNFALYSCSNSPSASENLDSAPINVNTPQAQEADGTLNNFDHQHVAKFAIATIMNQDENIISVSDGKDIYLVSYTRKTDSQNFKYKVRFDGKRIIWGNVDGRWRDGEYDEKVSFREDGNKLIIVQTFSDGSETLNEFSK